MPSVRDKASDLMRWQFGLRHLFAVMTVSAIAAPLFAAFGWPIVSVVLAFACLVSFLAPVFALVYMALSTIYERFERR